MHNKREYQYDLLRVISMIAIIIIHVSAKWVIVFNVSMHNEGLLSSLTNPFIACLYNSLSRFAVPCFVMLSGAFLLTDTKNLDYKYFYRKSFYKIGVPGIVITILYVLYRIPLCFFGEQQGSQEFLNIFIDVLSGNVMAHMWYWNMLIGLYLLVPIILRYMQSVSESTLFKVAAIFLVFASLSCWTTENIRVKWSIGLSFEYAGYLLIGYVIRKTQTKKGNGLWLIALGFLIEIGVAFIQYYLLIVKGIPEKDLSFSVYNPYSPVIVLASVLIFIGFSKIQIPKLNFIEKLAENSFMIYLIHMGVLDVTTKALAVLLGHQYYLKLNCVIWIPILTLTTLLISYIFAPCFNKAIQYGITKASRHLT